MDARDGWGLRVAGAQIPVTDDVTANSAAIVRAIEFAAGEKADILLTPEGSLSGYTASFDRAAVRAALAEVTRRAASHSLGLALGTCFEEADGKCYNQVRVYDRTGACLGFHAKTLLCGTMEARPEGEIDKCASAPLRTFSFHGLTIGALICNDLWANPGCTPMPDPHLTQQLADRGARAIFHAVNGGRDASEFSRRVVRNFHESNLLMRALAGRVWIVTVDNAHPVDQPASSPGGVVGPDGAWKTRAEPTGEQFFVSTIAGG